MQDQWTADVTYQHQKLAAERARWEALENRNTELEMKLSGLQRQFQWKVRDFQILERQSELETRVYREEKEKWVDEKKLLESQLAEKEKVIQRKSTELLLRQEGVRDAEHEKKLLHQKICDIEAENKLLHKRLIQLPDRGVKHRHQQRSRTSSFTDSSLSSVESGVSMSISVSV